MDFNDMVNLRQNIRKEGVLRFQDESKNRLEKITTKKIKTTMIGALATIETIFGFLWEPDQDGTLSNEKSHLYSLYEKARHEILDNGNNQIRNFKAELEQYNVEWKRYQLTLPVRKREDKDGESS